MKFSGGSAYTLGPHITVAKLLSVSSWLAGRMQADIWEMTTANVITVGQGVGAAARQSGE